MYLPFLPFLIKVRKQCYMRSEAETAWERRQKLGTQWQPPCHTDVYHNNYITIVSKNNCKICDWKGVFTETKETPLDLPLIMLILYNNQMLCTYNWI